jgi:hypothetical protein
MALDATARRRWIGAAILLAALAMVVGGETVLRDRLSPLGTLVYWLVVFLLTGAAILVAFLDLRALRRQTRQEHRELFEEALKQIQAEVQSKPRPGNRPQRPSRQ